MSSPYVGEIRIFGGTFAPIDWALCNGSLLQIAQYQALFTLLGTTYGGDGVNTFGLPDLRGRAALAMSNQYPIGALSGVPTVTLQTGQIPMHNHLFVANTVAGGTGTNPTGQMLSSNGNPKLFKGVPDAGILAQTAIAPIGNSIPHENMQPYQAISYIIAVNGVYPQR